MADIKFMDISENDNPATTDSILVANQENGVKRTTLSKIGDMFALHGLVHIEKVQLNLVKNTTYYQITAPTVEGYNFAFWLQPATVGGVLSSYISQPNKFSDYIYIAADNDKLNSAIDSGVTAVAAFAVYVKNEVA